MMFKERALSSTKDIGSRKSPKIFTNIISDEIHDDRVFCFQDHVASVCLVSSLIQVYFDVWVPELSRTLGSTFRPLSLHQTALLKPI